jgi:hypothetical protein
MLAIDFMKARPVSTAEARLYAPERLPNVPGEQDGQVEAPELHNHNQSYKHNQSDIRPACITPAPNY